MSKLKSDITSDYTELSGTPKRRDVARSSNKSEEDVTVTRIASNSIMTFGGAFVR